MALENGADDYITKPFHYEVVMAKIRSHLRRAYGAYASNQKEKRLESGELLYCFIYGDIAIYAAVYSQEPGAGAFEGQQQAEARAESFDLTFILGVLDSSTLRIFETSFRKSNL
ncbi:hypothetical protein GCM10008933_22730 [Paenibacillus motobuensis]|uniref:Response regulatory domain-containing protein n=1 Tax=Paenibacillus motobuensis TaxID=295324 RepID=A0ABP3I5E5_9BACL